MPHDFSIPLNSETYAAVSEVLRAFYAGGSSFNSPELLQSEAEHGLTFAEAVDAINAHRLYEAQGSQ